MTEPEPDASVRRRVRVTGIVQGVGFRPFVHSLATQLGLTGFVGNDLAGVFIEVEGPDDRVEVFTTSLVEQAPPAAIVDEVTSDPIPVVGGAGFEIVASEQPDPATALVSPDLDVCADCLTELRDPGDRRYRYPFINCTNCGPRFSIIEETPYDRAVTTMAPFEMCGPCRVEYEDPSNRRFHAQPNACPECGPKVWLVEGDVECSGDPITTTREVIASGGIVAIKGLGGFHLACDARNDNAVAELRRRKGRGAKPFAVMAADLATASLVVDLTPEAEELLLGRAKPVVVAPQIGGSLPEGIAPGNRTVGVMLPYTPLHHLLLESGDVWVMTSGNRSTEPIVTTNEAAQEQLGTIADAFLLHDRAIERPVDDSVIRTTGMGPSPIRRSRGYAPFPVRLAFDSPPALAVGGELKATLCLADGTNALMSQHIGDMENLETLDAFTETARDLQRLFRIEPEVFVSDQHPRYLSRRWALEEANGRPVIGVQHHQAHIASLLAEQRHAGPVIGFSFDGTGYGTDGTVWGGEVLVGSLDGFERVGHLATFPLPGGDAAVARPHRAALGLLTSLGIPWTQDLPPVAELDEEELRVLRRQLERELMTVATSSMGRLFDAVSSLAGVCQVATYEGQAAIELEAISGPPNDGYGFGLLEDGDSLVIDPRPMVDALLDDLRGGTDRARIAAKFHDGLASTIVASAEWARARTGIETVGLSGGVFQNARLADATGKGLYEAGFNVMTHALVPPNDGGLALGQIALAAHLR